MKKFMLFSITLVAVSEFSFSQVFDRLVVNAVGGLPSCNGSDIANPIACSQKAGNYPTCTGNYKKVTADQNWLDEISRKINECTASGCINVNNNDSPDTSVNGCTAHDKGMDPP